MAVTGQAERKGAYPDPAEIKLRSRVRVEAVVFGHQVEEPPLADREVDGGSKKHAAGRAAAVEVEVAPGGEHPASPPCCYRDFVFGADLETRQQGARDHVGAECARESPGALRTAEKPGVRIPKTVGLVVAALMIGIRGRGHVSSSNREVDVADRAGKQ